MLRAFLPRAVDFRIEENEDLNFGLELEPGELAELVKLPLADDTPAAPQLQQAFDTRPAESYGRL